MNFGIDPKTFKWAVVYGKLRPNLVGLPHETVDQFLKRGGKIKRCPSFVPGEDSVNKVYPIHARSVVGVEL